MEQNPRNTAPPNELRGLAALMERYVDGDDRAFGELHARLEPRVRGLVRRRISDPEAASDLVQAIFVKAHLARGRFTSPEGADPDRAVVVWYSAIARNAAIDALRKIYRRRAHAQQVSDKVTGEQFERIVDEQPDVETRMSDREQRDEIRALVREAVDSLPPMQREVLELHKLQGLSMREISERLSVREGTLRVRAHRAYKAFADRMRQLMPGLSESPA